MPEFYKTKFDLPVEWKESTKFDSKGGFVNKHGEYVDPKTYTKKVYQLESKYEREFECLERVGRVALGLFLALGLVPLFLKVVRDLIIKDKETIRFGVLVPSSSPPYISKIRKCMENILQRTEGNGLKFYTCQLDHRVFELDTAPGLIFKMKANKTPRPDGVDDSMGARYRKTIEAQTVLATHQLNLLILPKTELFNVNADGEDYEIIAEQKLDITPNESMQAHYFEEYADSLSETIRQLAVFICKTGYSDVEWRNNPVVNNSLGADGHRRIALIDIEEMDGAKTGLFGKDSSVFARNGRTGLVGLVNEEQGRIVRDVAQQNNVDSSRFSSEHTKRKEILENNREIKDYYARKNITTGDEPIHVDLSSLGLDLNKEDQLFFDDTTVTLGKVAEDVVEEINRLIKTRNTQLSLKDQRYLLIRTHKELWDGYNGLGLPKGALTVEDDKKKWPYVIIQALAAKGHIFKLIKVDGHGYHIQA